MKKLIALAALFAATASHASGAKPKESAFGFHIGMTLKQAKAVANLKQTAAYTWATNQPPKPVYPFWAYMLIIAPKAGVCGVSGATTPHPADSEEAKYDAKYVINMLRERYGDTFVPIEDGLKWVDAQGRGSDVQTDRVKHSDGNVSTTVSYLFSNTAECRKEMQEGL
jgi:hypothetical protein